MSGRDDRARRRADAAWIAARPVPMQRWRAGRRPVERRENCSQLVAMHAAKDDCRRGIPSGEEP